jgi:pimeloyl-ACP methyl ester carboxylesterase
VIGSIRRPRILGALGFQVDRQESERAMSAMASMSTQVRYHTARTSGLDIFYRDAGPADAPAILLLHGFPTSSNMFRQLIPRLATSYRLIAPDLPGYGYSSMPDRQHYAYTFENAASIVDQLLEWLNIGTYSMYVMDYGAPVGYRLALMHPERVDRLVVQNGGAYEEGLLKFWDPIKMFWREPTREHRNALSFMLDAETTRWQYENGVHDVTLLDPSTWTLDQALLDRRGNAEIQLDMLYDYRTNVMLYPAFQEFFRQYQPPTQILWGKNDFIFPVAGAEAYRQDLPDAEIHLLDTGHFALETHLDEIADRIQRFIPHPS